MQGSQNKKTRQFWQGAGGVKADKSFLTSHERKQLRAIAGMRRGDHPAGVRAMAILHLDDGETVAFASKALRAGKNTACAWRRAFRERGPDSIGMAGCSQREGPLSELREERLKALSAERPPRDTVEVRARVLEKFGVEYSRQGACKPVKRLGFVFAEPQRVPGVADEKSRRDSVRRCEKILDGLGPQESVVFANAAHREYRSHPPRGRFPKSSRPTLKATGVRRRLNPAAPST